MRATLTTTGGSCIAGEVDPGDLDVAGGSDAPGRSGRSVVLTGFAGGDGQLGIHGTNAPASIGEDVSFGYVRVPTAVARGPVSSLPVGAPVVIS